MNPRMKKHNRLVKIVTILLSIILIISVILFAVISFTPTTITRRFDSYAKVGDPGESVQFQYIIKMDGGFRSIHAKVQDIESQWDVTVENDNFIINSGEQKATTFTVDIPEDLSGDSKFDYSDFISFYVIEEQFGSRSMRSEQFVAYSSQSELSEIWASEDNFNYSLSQSGSISYGIDVNIYTIILGLILIASLAGIIFIQVKGNKHISRKKI